MEFGAVAGGRQLGRYGITCRVAPAAIRENEWKLGFGDCLLLFAFPML